MKDSAAASTLSTVIALDQNEIIAAVDVSNRKTSSDVADFAKMMIEDHGKNLTEAYDLANKIHALPLSPNASLASQSVKELSALNALEGDAYDKAYVDAMVKGHEAALKIVEAKLAAAKNEDLKNFLASTKETVAHHLEKAKSMQESMKN